MNQLRIAVVDDFESAAPSLADWEGLGADRVDFFGSAPFSELRDYDVIVAERGRRHFDEAAFEALPNMRLLVSTGMGVRHIDRGAALRHGVMVCGTESRGSATAELTWALIFELARGAGAEDRRVRAGDWSRHYGFELTGRTLAIAGAGRVGIPVGAVGKALGMDVIAWSSRDPAERDDSRLTAAGIERVHSREEFFRRADILAVLLLPVPATLRSITAEDLRMMPSRSYVVNTGRADLLEEGALVTALAEGWIAGAAVDVFEQAPPPVDDPLLAAPNVVLSGHRGFVTEENLRTHYGQAVEDIRGWLAGEPLRRLI